MYYFEGSRHKNRLIWVRKFKERSNYKVKKLVILYRDKIIKCKYILYIESMEKWVRVFVWPLPRLAWPLQTLLRHHSSQEDQL